jgi:hypothetical protein
MIHHSDILQAEVRAQVKFFGLSIDFPEKDRARFFEFALPFLAKKTDDSKRVNSFREYAIA